jgi:hypothetical protein
MIDAAEEWIGRIPGQRQPRRNAEIVVRAMVGETDPQQAERFGVTRQAINLTVRRMCAHLGKELRGLLTPLDAPTVPSYSDPLLGILERVKVDAKTGCWEWQGSGTNGGYGQASVGGRKVYTHRYTYERFVGPIPDGLVIDHLCRNRHCANPLHLEPVSMRENLVRSPHWKDGSWVWLTPRTHCKRGHEFTAENTGVISTTGNRYCRECNRIMTRARYYAKKAAA